MKHRFAVIALLLVVLGASNVRADNFAGKITLVQTTSNGTRFFVQPQGLSLFTTSAEHRAVLLEAFFRKASVSVSYTKIACTNGIAGTCGTVVLVTVDQTNLP